MPTEEINRAAEECRKAFEGIEVGALVSHCHHEQWLERLTEPAENRIRFILENKSVREQAERLRRFRPFDWEKADADWEKAYADWKKADAAPAMLKVHAEVCGCAWSTTTDIFGEKR